jgi:cytoskeletal protein CcmA (bactofilin family)
MNDKTGSNGIKQTLVEEGTEFVGKLTSKCPIVVMGNVEGEVTGPIIHVTRSGVVAGNVKVKELRSEGELAGSVEADVVRIAGKIRDRTVIRARTLEVTLTSNDKAMEVLFGECELAIGDEPNKAAAVAAANPETKKPETAAAAASSPAEPAFVHAPEVTPTEEANPRRKRGTLPQPA